MLFGSTRAGQAPGRGAGIAAITSITGAVALLSLSDALVKLLAGDGSLGQLLLLRSGVAALLLAGVMTGLAAGWRGAAGRAGAWRPHRWVWLRSLCLALMWISYYAALPHVPLPLAAACYYTAPMWMALLSALFLGTRLGRRGLLALALGLAGTAVLLRFGTGAAPAPQPSSQALSPLLALPLLAGILYALAAVITRGRCRDVPPLALALNLNLVLAGAGALLLAGAWLGGGGAGFVLGPWAPPDTRTWALMAGLGGMLALITVAVAFAYQAAPAPVVGLFDNGYLVFALLWGVLLFGDRPGPAALAGIALIGGGAVLASAPPAAPRVRLAREGAARGGAESGGGRSGH